LPAGRQRCGSSVEELAPLHRENATMRRGEKRVEIADSNHFRLGCRRGLAAQPAIDQAALAMTLAVEPVGDPGVFGADHDAQFAVVVEAGLVAVKARLPVLAVYNLGWTLGQALSRAGSGLLQIG